MTRTLLSCCFFALLFGCQDETTTADPVTDLSPDSSGLDAALPDAALPDATEPDAALPDAAIEPDAAEPLIPPAMWGPAPAETDRSIPGVISLHLVAAPQRWSMANGADIDGFAYNEQVPGPTIQAHVGDEIEVIFENRLPFATTIHWHGLRISDLMDGNPRIQEPIEPGETFTYRFTAREAGTFWYHPHMRTNEAVEKGLYGAIIIHDIDDPKITERILLLDDILYINGQLPPFLASHPEVMHGRRGNVLLTNGHAMPPQLNIEQGTVERWRITNTSNARSMLISFEGAQFKVIGVDGGRLTEPYKKRALNVAVGQRYEVEVRYARPGTARMISYIQTQQGTERATIIEMTVQPSDAALPTIEWPTPEPQPFRPTTTRMTLVFDAVQDPNTGLRWRINGRDDWGDEPVFTAEQGDVVEITLDNRAGPEHPFHLHGQFFEIIGDGRPETEQPGLKDTVLVPGRSTVDIVAYLDNPGKWMAHCHILEHAELGMMSSFEITPR